MSWFGLALMASVGFVVVTILLSIFGIGRCIDRQVATKNSRMSLSHRCQQKECGAANPRHALYCSRCGQRLDSAVAPLMRGTADA